MSRLVAQKAYSDAEFLLRAVFFHDWDYKTLLHNFANQIEKGSETLRGMRLSKRNKILSSFMSCFFLMKLLTKFF